MNYKQKSRSEWLDEYHEGVRYGLQGKLILEESSPFKKSPYMKAKDMEKHYYLMIVG